MIKIKKASCGDYYIFKKQKEVDKNIFITPSYFVYWKIIIPNELRGKRIRFKVEVIE